MQFKIEKQAKEDLKFFKKNNPHLYKKCLKLIEDILAHPETWIWKPEHLKYFWENIWSRRVNQEHRIVYILDYNIPIIKFLSFRFHYNFK